MISKSAGGIGLSFTNVRASGSLIKSTGGKSADCCHLPEHDATARAVDQGRQTQGSIYLYLEPWHKDILTFLSLKNITERMNCVLEIVPCLVDSRFVYEASTRRRRMDPLLPISMS